MNKATSQRAARADLDPRAAARTAARREGKSLGEWLQDVIADSAEPLQRNRGPVAVESERAEEARRSRTGAPPDDEDFGAPGRWSSRRAPRRDQGARQVSDAFADTATPATEMESLLDEALQAMERRAVRSERRTEDALASLTHLLEETDVRRDRERSAVADLGRKVSTMETRLAERQSHVDAPIRSALARLEARLDALSQRAASEVAADGRTTGRDADRAGAERAPLRALDEKLDSILATLVDRPRGGGPEISAGALAAHRAAEVRDLDSGRPLGTAITEIANRQRSLEAASNPVSGLRRRLERELRNPGLEQVSAAPAESGSAGAITALRAEMVGLATSVDAIRRELSEQRSQALHSDDVAAMHAEIRQVSNDMKTMAPGPSLRSLQTAIKALDEKLTSSRSGVFDEAALRPVEAAVGDLRDSLSLLDPRQAVAPLEAEMREISRRLEHVLATGSDAAALSELQGQMGEIRQALAAKLPTMSRIELGLSKLDDHLERQAFLPDVSHELGAATDALRAIVADPPGSSTLKAIEARLDLVLDKIEGATQCEARRPPLDDHAVSTVALEAMLRDLSSKMEAAQHPHGKEGALDALQLQIAALSERFERSEVGMAALPKLQASMHDLFDHLEITRASIEVSATRAAREAVRMAENDPHRQSEQQSSELAALQMLQEEADSRTQSTLGIVHATLEKVVDRLTAMEQEIVTLRVHAPAAVQPRIAAGDARAEIARPIVPEASARTARPTPTHSASLSLDQGLGRADGRRDPLFNVASAKPPQRGAVSPRLPQVEIDEDSNRADFIAAARRAAKAAQNDPGVLAAQSGTGPNSKEARAGLLARSRDFVATHKRPVLLSIAALFVLMGTMALMQRQAVESDVSMATRDPAGKIARIAESLPATKPFAARPVKLADLSPSALPSEALSPSVLPRSGTPKVDDAAGARALAAPIPGSDPIQTGSIPSLPAFAQRPMGAAPTGTTLPPNLQAAAENGNGAAEYELGTRFADGRGVTRDFKQASDWFKKAADAGITPAKYRLASLFEKGLGVPLDKMRAKSLYLQAADAGNPRAMHNLAVLLADGDGKPDYVGAALWFRRAAQYGIHDSQYNLAILLARGLGLQQSLVQSYMWFAVAAKADDADAAKKRDEIASKLGDADLAAAKALAAAFQPKTAEPAAVEVQPPSGGWDGALPTSHLNSTRSKISML